MRPILPPRSLVASVRCATYRRSATYPCRAAGSSLLRPLVLRGWPCWGDPPRRCGARGCRAVDRAPQRVGADARPDGSGARRARRAVPARAPLGEREHLRRVRGPRDAHGDLQLPHRREGLARHRLQLLRRPLRRRVGGPQRQPGRRQGGRRHRRQPGLRPARLLPRRPLERAAHGRGAGSRWARCSAGWPGATASTWPTAPGRSSRPVAPTATRPARPSTSPPCPGTATSARRPAPAMPPTRSSPTARSVASRAAVRPSPRRPPRHRPPRRGATTTTAGRRRPPPRRDEHELDDDRAFHHVDDSAPVDDVLRVRW